MYVMLSDYNNAQCLREQRKFGSSLFYRSTASNGEYFKIFPLLNSSKYSSLQLYSHETNLIQKFLFLFIQKSKLRPARLIRGKEKETSQKYYLTLSIWIKSISWEYSCNEEYLEEFDKGEMLEYS